MGLQNELADKEETRVIHPDEECEVAQHTQHSLLAEAAGNISDCFQSVESALLSAATSMTQSEGVTALSGFLDTALHGGDSEAGDEAASEGGGNHEHPFVFDLTLPPPPIKLSGFPSAKKA